MFFFMKIMQERLPIRLNRVRKTHKKQGTKLTKKKTEVPGYPISPTLLLCKHCRGPFNR